MEREDFTVLYQAIIIYNGQVEQTIQSDSLIVVEKDAETAIETIIDNFNANMPKKID